MAKERLSVRLLVTGLLSKTGVVHNVTLEPTVKSATRFPRRLSFAFGIKGDALRWMCMK